MQSPYRQANMTFWSRHDAVRMPTNTDNWAKLRMKSNVYRTMRGMDGFTPMPELSSQTWRSKRGARFQVSEDGKVQRLGEKSFVDLVSREMRGSLPGNLSSIPTSSSLRRSWRDNEFHRRAKGGFRYWLIERPAPTQFGKYGFGTFKTVLGVGNAPRT